MVTVALDALLLNKFSSYGCFKFIRFIMFGKSHCDLSWHLGIEAFLEAQGFIAIVAMAIFVMVIIIAKYTCLKGEQ